MIPKKHAFAKAGVDTGFLEKLMPPIGSGAKRHLAAHTRMGYAAKNLLRRLGQATAAPSSD
jgi:hypothetical protein